MSRKLISRRRFLTLPLALALAPLEAVCAEIQPRKGSYSVDVGILHDLISFHMVGTIDEALDRPGGRYEVKLVGEGAGIANRVTSTGRRLNGRWAPLRTSSWFQVRGRESRSEVTYDYARRIADYHFRGETFFLRRLRVVDDTLPIPEGMHVDDVMSALFNFVDQDWKADADGLYRTHVVRRRRSDTEGPDDVPPDARAELAPLALKVEVDPATGKTTASFDMSRFSSWARRDRPAQVVFAANRRPELITSSLILGTSITVRLRES